MKQQLEWTTLEQSKKLIEAGLDQNTADMFYDKDINNDIIGPYCLIEKTYLDESNQYPDITIPCWSLGRLIELIPFNPTVNGIKVFFQLNQLGCRYVYRDDDLSIKEVVVFANSNLIDNVISMICWLLENNYIKKRETK